MAKSGTTSIIVGFGEIGRGLHKVVGGDYFDLTGNEQINHADYDVMHICFPYSDRFEIDVEMYADLWEPKLIIVHSTVPIGTCDKLGVVHSPVRGVHPHLDKGIKTFVKYVGGKNADKAARYFKGFGIKSVVCKRAKETEALKLWDTTQYGMMILLNKYMKYWCNKHGVDFDVIYGEANRSYNDGYVKLGRDEVVRPYLKYMKGNIGGHCVIPNAKLFNSIPSWIIRAFDLWNRIKN